MPPIEHVIYIPAVLMIGVVLGYIFGSRAAKDHLLAEQARKEARAERRARNAAEAANHEDAAATTPHQPPPPA